MPDDLRMCGPRHQVSTKFILALPKFIPWGEISGVPHDFVYDNFGQVLYAMFRGLFMSSRVFGCSFAFLLALSLHADPIKKDNKAANNKLAKETVEKFWKQLKNKEHDDAVKHLAVPFRRSDGFMIESIESLKREMIGFPTEGVEFTISDGIELGKLNEEFKKLKSNDVSEENLKKYEELIGTNGRVVPIVMKVNGVATPVKQHLHLLIKIDGVNVHLVGMGGELLFQ
jgi:hypothetical protein